MSRSTNQPRRAQARAAKADDGISIVRILATGLLALAALIIAQMSAAQASEADVPAPTVERMQAIITSQIAAFRADDAEAAYAFAAPGIRSRFPSASRFASMVQNGYPAVYSPQSFSFQEAALSDTGQAQTVEFIGQDGQVWLGLYTFEEAMDGDLAITGVFLRRQNARQI